MSIQTPDVQATQEIAALLKQAEVKLSETIWPLLEETAQTCFERVLNAFTDNRVGEEHLGWVTGYGHDDMGRQVTDKVFAQALQAEAAMVRTQIVSGTHAIAVALRGCLSVGDTLLTITGQPYDTLEEVIGLRGDSHFSLKAQGVHYQQFSIFDEHDDRAARLEFTATEIQQIKSASTVFIQRSRGYSPRPSLSIAHLKVLIEQLKAVNPKLTVMVDNCYGEFTEANEPPAVGADLIAGSLIKNPGGGIIAAGGYVAGRADLVKKAADALTCPGVGTKGGCTFDQTRLMLQGLFLAPGVVKEALKGMTLAACVFEELGYNTSPHWQDSRSDIIQMIHLGDSDKLVNFCQTLQKVSPVESAITPIPAEVPGYEDQVVMAAGTFIEGSTIELSADGPLRPPYTVYLQGGLTLHHTRYVLRQILEKIAR